MNSKVFKRLFKRIQKSDKSIRDIMIDLDGIIRSNKKDFDVTFGDKEYSFRNPFTQEEMIQQKEMRLEFLRFLFADVFNHYLLGISSIEDEPNFSLYFQRILAFGYGVNPKDFTMKQSDKIDITKISNGKIKKKSVKLDEDTYQVKNEMGLLDDQESI